MKLAYIGLTLVVITAGCQQKSPTTVQQSSTTVPVESTDPADPGDQTLVSDASDWISDSWNSAVQTGSQSTSDSTAWLNEKYKSAVDQGLTSAKSMKDWVAADLQSQGDWEYQIVTVDPDDVSGIEKQLNELGKSRWDCFHMTERNDQWVLFLKRSRKSVLSRVPLRDLINFLPLGGDAADGH